MKLGVITDGISQDFEHALKVLDNAGLAQAELQYVWDREVGDHSEIASANSGVSSGNRTTSKSSPLQVAISHPRSDQLE